jgi:hypothetical protein
MTYEDVAPSCFIMLTPVPTEKGAADGLEEGSETFLFKY